jgi:hypothetical protein
MSRASQDRASQDRYDDRWAAADRGYARSGARERRGPITPLRVVLLLAILGALAYIAYTILFVRDTSALPLLIAGAVLLGILFLVLAAVAGRGVWVAGREGRTRDAWVLAIGGGIAAMIGFGSLAMAVIGLLLLQSV